MTFTTALNCSVNYNEPFATSCMQLCFSRSKRYALLYFHATCHSPSKESPLLVVAQYVYRQVVNTVYTGLQYQKHKTKTQQGILSVVHITIRTKITGFNHYICGLAVYGTLRMRMFPYQQKRVKYLFVKMADPLSKLACIGDGGR